MRKSLFAVLVAIALGATTANAFNTDCNYIEPNYCRLLRHYLELNEKRQADLKIRIGEIETAIVRLKKLKKPKAAKTIELRETETAELEKEQKTLKQQAGELYSHILFLSGEPMTNVKHLEIERDIVKEVLDREIKKADPRKPIFNPKSISAK